MTQTFGQQLGTKFLKFLKRFYERFPLPEGCNHAFVLEEGKLRIWMVRKHEDGKIKHYPLTFEKEDYKKTEDQLFTEIDNYFKDLEYDIKRNYVEELQNKLNSYR